MASYDKVYELVREIKGSSEYKEYQKAKQELEENDTALSLLKEYRKIEIKIQQASLLGQEPSEEDKSEFSRLAELIKIHGSIYRYLESERQMMLMLVDIQRIISEAMNLLDLS